MSSSALRFACAIVPLLIAACASNPSPGSLAAIHQQADREVLKRCLRTAFTTNKHVPLLTLSAACERTLHQSRANRRSGPVAQPASG